MLTIVYKIFTFIWFGKHLFLAHVAAKVMNQKFLKQPIFWVLCSALMLTLSWQPSGFFILVFGGFVPLLYLEEKLRNRTGFFFLLLFLSLLLWNIGVTYWVCNASAVGGVAAFLINTLLMCLPFMLMHRMMHKAGPSKAYTFFIAAWLAFEYLHLNWEISWPWLTLGNVFSTAPDIVQWYEYTGALGGSFWVLLVNIKMFRYLKSLPERSKPMRFSKGFNLAFFYLLVPTLLSWHVLADYKQKGKPMRVMVVQPNIDPYTDKFEGMSPEEQVGKMLQLAEANMDSSVQLICFPETALLGGLDEDHLAFNTVIRQVRDFLEKHPQVQILSGADTYSFYKSGETLSETARRYNDMFYYDAYNSAIFFNQTDRISIYHKSKLVPGVERMPYPALFKFLENLTLELGGTSGSLGRDNGAKVFDMGRGNLLAPVICYESVYGEYVGSYVKKGAGLICVVTNDGWWGNTPGYQQHFNYAKLRAIEMRKYIARAANTGISGFIDDKGQTISSSSWWVPDALKADLYIMQSQTFYATYGDYIGVIGVLIFILNLPLLFRKRILD
jgi:apolipoprotein N-acyltransferase